MLDLTKINKKNIESKNDTSSSGSITIITARENIASGLATQIRMNVGIEVTRTDACFYEMTDGKMIPSSNYVIIDLENFNDISIIEQKIKFLLPITTKKYLLAIPIRFVFVMK